MQLPEHDVFVETNDQAAGPDEYQEREEDRDEDGVADAGHREFKSNALQVRPSC